MHLNSQQILALYLINIKSGFRTGVTVELLSQDTEGDILADIAMKGYAPRRVKLHTRGGFQGDFTLEATMGNGPSSDDPIEDIASDELIPTAMGEGSSNG